MEAVDYLLKNRDEALLIIFDIEAKPTTERTPKELRELGRARRKRNECEKQLERQKGFKP